MGALGAGLGAASMLIPGAGPVMGAISNIAGNAITGAYAIALDSRTTKQEINMADTKSYRHYSNCSNPEFSNRAAQ